MQTAKMTMPMGKGKKRRDERTFRSELGFRTYLTSSPPQKFSSSFSSAIHYPAVSHPYAQFACSK